MTEFCCKIDYDLPKLLTRLLLLFYGPQCSMAATNNNTYIHSMNHGILQA